MNAYVPDANELAKRTERREQEAMANASHSPTQQVRGTLMVWLHVQDFLDSNDPRMSFENVAAPDLTKGCIIIYHEDMDATILYPAANWYVEFVLNREGE